LPREITAIRGLDQEAYRKIFSLAKQNDKRVADLINEALRRYIQTIEGSLNPIEQPNPVIENAGTMTLSRAIILGLHQELGKEFSIRNSGKLIMDQDVTKETLQHLKTIVNTSSGTIRAPKHIYHAVILKSKNYGSLEMY
jgi:hypothetical protein